MSRRADTPASRRDFQDAVGVLLITREPPPPPPPVKGQPAAVPGNPAEGVEILIAVWDDGSVTALNGHVDLGTGIRTALAQIAAEELDVPMDRINMVLGDTTRAPNQGATIASASIQIHAVPLRIAAAQARTWLVAQAAERLGVHAAELAVDAGIVSVRGQAERAISYAELVQGRHVELLLDAGTPIKRPEDYKLVGQSMPRVDIPAKATGELTFVHDLRVPGMLHGRVIRPPYAGADHGDFIGNTLESVDEQSIAHIPGIVAVVTIGDFVGVVAQREEHAEQAMRELVVTWKDWPALPNLANLEVALRNNPSTRRVVAEQGDVDAALANAAVRMDRTYVWPYQLHASIGPSCAVADWRSDRMTVWAGSQNPHVLRADLAKLMDLPDVAIDVIRMEAAGCYGRNCADDVAADAALLSRAVGHPVRVQLTREQEHQWEPKGAAQLMEVRGGLNADGSVAAYDFQTSYPSNGALTLALLLTGKVSPGAVAYEMGDRTSVPPYDYQNLRVAINDMAPILRASWLRGVSALPNSFAHESYIDELAAEAGVDPVEFRLRYLKDDRAAELVRATVERAGWLPHTKPQQQPPDGDFLKGQGFAYARYTHSRFPGFGAAWAAWVADVEVNRNTGEVHVRRVVVGQDAGLMINPAGVRQQIHGNVVQTTSRALKEEVQVDSRKNTVVSKEWGSYPILNFREVPVIDVMMMQRPDQPPQGAGESSSVPGTAAIANAIFDATGVRFRQPPFTAEVVKAALHPPPAEPAKPPRTRRPWWAIAGALVAGLGAAAFGMRPAIPEVARIDPSIYTAETIERGRRLAAAGDCTVCHTAPNGARNAGGRALDTPFGKIYTTNLTPDPETGIGKWSFTAFQRAMREGISRDGRHLYPAFPYTSFTKVTDDDLMALYAYLMTQPPVRTEVPETKLAFPFSVRPMMGLWNALYLKPGPDAADPARSAQWNRGAYLVNGLGHCTACHTPRNALGAEKAGRHYLGGAVIDGWEAPPLTSITHAPVPWTEQELFRYLRYGHTEHHGVAAGPMMPVVQELATLPEQDVRAMAHYLASFNAAGTGQDAQAAAGELVAAAKVRAGRVIDADSRLFSTACGSCHHDGNGPALLGLNKPFALNSNLHSGTPDNLVQVILNGVPETVSRDGGYMPAFKHSLNDEQIARIAGYMRQRYAPDKPAWNGIEQTVAKLRAAHE
ncbi:MAG TPA: molybdopterin cofactor-binding domain-containing protein [Noviherbaspirillum sp.]|jgi:nicotinate dehydrogenase subunit B|uniref:molybdopterin cofactor-binding domain-containing protein n=1 Tax=Noviherbaspirillum sp. TaxID=1926288 RepID=UPI002DDCE440|nr:molybdopterin cofactor-binding domain-containing protein [Noviherbaspirillum sp.]HEV2612236.1 molybdopterin cofactor-binding domain-containing protein [Noviherbaspirillum sp.]